MKWKSGSMIGKKYRWWRMIEEGSGELRGLKDRNGDRVSWAYGKLYTDWEWEWAGPKDLPAEKDVAKVSLASLIYKPPSAAASSSSNVPSPEPKRVPTPSQGVLSFKFWR